jgi:hypothetical protein
MVARHGPEYAAKPDGPTWIRLLALAYPAITKSWPKNASTLIHTAGISSPKVRLPNSRVDLAAIDGCVGCAMAIPAPTLGRGYPSAPSVGGHRAYLATGKGPGGDSYGVTKPVPSKGGRSRVSCSVCDCRFQLPELVKADC